MNEGSPPPVLTDATEARDRRRIWTGFGVGLIALVVPVLGTMQMKGDAMGALMLAALFCFIVVPVTAIVLAIVRRTRKFGLGLLLACGIGFLVLLAICGGLMK
jgi:hypothetical protein